METIKVPLEQLWSPIWPIFPNRQKGKKVGGEKSRIMNHAPLPRFKQAIYMPKERFYCNYLFFKLFLKSRPIFEI